jgi:hypothetical protein
MALYALEELQRRGHRVPEDVSVSGFDDTQIAMSHDPALTTVHQPLGKLGYACVRRFVEALRNGSLTPPGHRMDAHLVLRESCGCVDSPETVHGIETEIRQQYAISPSQQTEPDVVIHNMSRNIIGTFNEDEIRSALDDSLRLFGIEDFSLARYTDAENSVVFYSLEGDRGQVFLSNRLVHRGISNESSGCRRKCSSCSWTWTVSKTPMIRMVTRQVTRRSGPPLRS